MSTMTREFETGTNDSGADGTGTHEKATPTPAEKRAQAVAAELRKRLPGVELTVEGRGESEPVASNETEAGRALNRRVAVTFVGGEK